MEPTINWELLDTFKASLVNTFKLFAQDPEKRTRGELIGCFRELASAIEYARASGMEHFSIKSNNSEWEW